MGVETPFRQTHEFIRGRMGEQIVAHILKERGWCVIPSYDYAGEDGDKPPRMEGLREAFSLPDLDVARRGRRFWIEVKTKADATLNHNTGRVEHGMSLRLYRQYLRVQEETGNAVWLCVYEEKSGAILIGRLTDLAENQRIYDGPKMGPSGMIFFLRRDFTEVSRITEQAVR